MRALSSNVVTLYLAIALGLTLVPDAVFAQPPPSPVNPTTMPVPALDFVLHYADVSAEPPNHSVSSPKATSLSRIAANIDQCTNSLNSCLASCAIQRDQCIARTNDKSYCGPAYNTCATSCQNHNNSCVK